MMAEELDELEDDQTAHTGDYLRPPSAWSLALPYLPWVVVALLLALGLTWGYQNLKWSGALQRRLEAVRASGQPMQPSELVPPPIPDAENAAFIYQQVFHIAFGMDAQNDAPLVSGFTKNDAKAVAAYVATGDPEQESTVAAILARPAVQEALRIFAEGSQRRDCQFPVIWADGPNAAMPHLEKLRASSLMLAAAVRHDFRQGRREEAMHWAAVGLRMARHAGTDPDRLAGLAQFAMCTTVLRSVREMVCAVPSPGPHQELDGALRALDFSGEAEHDLRGELALEFQVFNSLGQDARTTRALLGQDYNNSSDAGRWARYLGPLAAPWRAHDECVFLDFMSKLQKSQTSPHPATRWEEDDLIAGTEQAATGWRAPVSNILVSVYDEYLSKRDLAQAEVSLCEVALALRDYQAQHGQFPDKLKDLPPPPAGPPVTDLYSGQPLVYHRERTGFMLYSLGPARRDEEGQPNEDEQGRVLDTGNIVWSCGEQ